MVAIDIIQYHCGKMNEEARSVLVDLAMFSVSKFLFGRGSYLLEELPDCQKLDLVKFRVASFPDFLRPPGDLRVDCFIIHEQAAVISSPAFFDVFAQQFILIFIGYVESALEIE